MFFEGIHSEGRLMEVINVNLAHYWYLGYGQGEPIPGHSALGKIRDRHSLEIFQQSIEHPAQLRARSLPLPGLRARAAPQPGFYLMVRTGPLLFAGTNVLGHAAQLLVADRFDQRQVGLFPHSITEGCVCRSSYHKGFRQPIVGADAVEQLAPINAWKVEIQEDQIGHDCLQAFVCRHTIVDDLNFITGRAKGLREDRCQILFVFNDQGYESSHVSTPGEGRGTAL